MPHSNDLTVKYFGQTYFVRKLPILQVHILIGRENSSIQVEYQGDRKDLAFILRNKAPNQYDEKKVSNLVEAIFAVNKPYRLGI